MKKTSSVNQTGLPPWVEVRTSGKKVKPGKFASWMEVAMAFARGDHLTKRERKEAMWNFRGGFRMPLRKACLIAFKYFQGWIPETREHLPRLTLAWLRLGKMWRRIERVVKRLFKFSPSLSAIQLHKWLSNYFAHNKPAWAW